MNQTRYSDYPPVVVTTGAERISIDGSAPENSITRNVPYNIQQQRKSHLEYVTASCNSKFYTTSKSTVFTRGNGLASPDQGHRHGNSMIDVNLNSSIASPITSNKNYESVLSSTGMFKDMNPLSMNR